MLASQSAGCNGNLNKEHSALLIDEMMITNGIMYSVTRNKVFGLAEIASHRIKNEIYQDFYNMKSENTQPISTGHSIRSMVHTTAPTQFRLPRVYHAGRNPERHARSEATDANCLSIEPVFSALQFLISQTTT